MTALQHTGYWVEFGTTKKEIVMRAFVVAVVLLTGCSGIRPCSKSFGCEDTPIGNYTGWGKCQPGQCVDLQELKSYSCNLGETEVVVRGAKNPDPQTCKPLERI